MMFDVKTKWNDIILIHQKTIF